MGQLLRYDVGGPRLQAALLPTFPRSWVGLADPGRCPNVVLSSAERPPAHWVAPAGSANFGSWGGTAGVSILGGQLEATRAWAWSAIHVGSIASALCLALKVAWRLHQ
ncbi:hypothetical protein NDU88_005081 [Pleurodeles waltl]|uniref:Uncharacterized protein n=1 Tax=Pleurodeles waltl TaxID=8319 RepID=A0AAV7MWS3_PLEWA|nr:hypothetical protein NDU88_005081 [Pleurodeles waltl]